jgi:hypothetical protein
VEYNAKIRAQANGKNTFTWTGTLLYAKNKRKWRKLHLCGHEKTIKKYIPCITSCQMLASCHLLSGLVTSMGFGKSHEENCQADNFHSY